MCPLPVHPPTHPVPEVRPAYVPREAHAQESAHPPDPQAPGGAASTARGPRLRFLSQSPYPPWPGARAMAAIPSGYQSSDVHGVYVDSASGKHFIIHDGKAYPVVHEPNAGQRRSIGLRGGGDTDPAARREQLEHRKADVNTKLGELSRVKSTLESRIADEKRDRQNEERAIETRKDGKRRAEQLLDQLKQKQQQGEPDLQSSIDTLNTEVQGWDVEIQRVQQNVERSGRSVGELEGTLRILESDRRRLEGELNEAERDLSRL
jgi:hypothetical protein